jgi:predicted nuclease of predicted toxin-antitoxin system
LDQGIRHRVAADLRGLGWDVVHTADIGLATSSDEEIMTRASESGRTIVTLDSDFSMLLALSGVRRPSVIHLRIPRLSRAQTVRLVRQVVAELQAQLQRGCIVSVSDQRLRIRSLPVAG